MPKYSVLLLHPSDYQASFELEPIIHNLQEIGFIAAPFGELDPTRHFLAGEGFLDHITFLGCSPTFCLDPAQARFCHVELGRSPGIPQLFVGPGPLRPRCPRCRKPVAEPDAVAQTLRTDPHAIWQCASCGREAELAALDWRHQAALAAVWVMVWGIEPELAVPGEALMERLAALTGSRWDYSYATI